MKTVKQIKLELEGIKNEIEKGLKDWIKDNPDVSLSMHFDTETDYTNTMSGEKLLISKKIKSELTITID